MNVDRHDFEMGLYELLGLKPLTSNPDAGAASGVANVWLDAQYQLHIKRPDGVDLIVQTSGASGDGFAPVDALTTAGLPTNTYASASQTMTMSATGVVTVNGVALAVGMRVAAFGEGSANNGIYRVTVAGAVGVALVMVRDSDASASADWLRGKTITVSAADNTNGGKLFEISNSAAVTLDTTTISVAEISDMVTTGTVQTISGIKTFSADLHGTGMWYEGIGSALVVTANVIAPTSPVHHCGAGLIKTITAPAGSVAGQSPTVTLIPDSAFTYDATGNIVVPAGGGTATVNRAMTFTLDPGTAKWYPSY
jgi:hypothetical protein